MIRLAFPVLNAAGTVFGCLLAGSLVGLSTVPAAAQSSWQSGEPTYRSQPYPQQPAAPGIYVPPSAGGAAPQQHGAAYQPRSAPTGQAGYSSREIINDGHRFFGQVSTDMASAVEYVFARYGEPTAYIAGEEASGALFAGARYGEGVLHMRHGDSRRIFWQGPSVGLDVGGDGSRVMVLVYGLPDAQAIYDTFGSTTGVAYMAGGVGVTFQSNERNVQLAVIRSGVGLRLGINLGFIKYTAEPTWNPF